MRADLVILLTGVALALPGLQAADDARELLPAFAWRQPLEGVLDAGTLYKVRVPAEVHDGSVEFGRDLRIIDSTARQWPWYLWTPEDVVRFQELPVRRLNESMVEAVPPYLRVEIRVAPASAAGPPPRHNRITLETEGTDFIRKAEILGRAGPEDDWGLLGSGFLIDHRQPVPTHNSLIRYTETDYPYLQVRVYPNARDAQAAIVLRSIAPGMHRRVPGEWEEVPLTALEVPARERMSEAQVLMLETDARRRPVERITLEIAESEFARPVVVYGRTDATNHWRRLYEGELHRL